MKCLSLAIALLPLGGCAIGVGNIFAALLNAEAVAPEMDDVLFSHTMLGFALIETFVVIIGCIILLIFLL